MEVAHLVLHDSVSSTVSSSRLSTLFCEFLSIFIVEPRTLKMFNNNYIQYSNHATRAGASSFDERRDPYNGAAYLLLAKKVMSTFGVAERHGSSEERRLAWDEAEESFYGTELLCVVGDEDEEAHDGHKDVLDNALEERLGICPIEGTVTSVNRRTSLRNSLLL
uniref:Peptidase_M16 domain-containing protein n=1 Tax=Steinernema glaseri TaxID=37863 RepID=A0A1I7YEE6_9BILA